MTLKTTDIVKHFKSLSHEEQRSLLSELTKELKSPTYSILFKLTPTHLAKLSKTVLYCKKHSVEYVTGKVGETKVKFTFKDLETRNQVLLGIHTM